MHYVNTAFDFLANCLLEKGKYVVIQSNENEDLQFYCRGLSFFFLKGKTLNKLDVALNFLTILSLNSNAFCQSYLLVKIRNHLKPENLETPFLLSVLKKPIKSVNSYQAEIKYLEDA